MICDLLLLLLLLVVVGWLVGCCCTCNTSYCRIFMGPENRHIGGVFVFFDALGAKHTVNTDVFCAS